jgi:hypothetical protein
LKISAGISGLRLTPTGTEWPSAGRILPCAGLWSLTICSIAILGCSESHEAPSNRSPKAQPILVIGVDGFEWDVLLPMIRRGQMPETAKLMARGTFGTLETLRPTESPLIWTTIATGKGPEKHGITGFTHPERNGTEDELFNSQDRKTKAIWNIASDASRRVGVVGWWMTYPVEPINGVMLAQTNTSDAFRKKLNMPWKGGLKHGVQGQVYPPEREVEVLSALPLIDAKLGESLIEIFGEFPEPLDPAERALWAKGSWSARADITYRQLALQLLDEAEPYDLFLVYFGGTDVYAHRYWRYYEPERFSMPIRVKSITNFRSVIIDYYRYIDRTIGELIARAPADCRVFIVADHGMHPDPSEMLEGRTRNPVASHEDAPPGVFIAAGPEIAASAKRPTDLGELSRSDILSLGSVVDVTPTLLALMGLPLNENINGRVLTHVLDEEALTRRQQHTVLTHDTEDWRVAREEERRAAPGQNERLEQLRLLGYIEDTKDIMGHGDHDEDLKKLPGLAPRGK